MSQLTCLTISDTIYTHIQVEMRRQGIGQLSALQIQLAAGCTNLGNALTIELDLTK